MALPQPAYAESTESVIRKIVKSGMTVAEVGTNGGLFTLAFADLVGPCGRVYAFEADAKRAQLVRDGVAAKGFADRVDVRSCVVSDGIRSDGLDALLRYRPVDVVKIDTQGDESLVVWGAPRSIASARACIFELFPRRVSAAGEEPRGYLHRFVSRGFRLFRVNDRKRRMERTTVDDLIKPTHSQVVAIRTLRRTP